ncbi:hypothetical protein Ciccas_010634 [Cichlidogyrus casuarinus]|uniref:Uncharacterized protein n=1 Tax=Cichlidogyrus casuarinus TaxID=1844966 RepID=A0ABD2PU51_9PLAT
MYKNLLFTSMNCCGVSCEKINPQQGYEHVHKCEGYLSPLIQEQLLIAIILMFVKSSVTVSASLAEPFECMFCCVFAKVHLQVVFFEEKESQR